MLKKMNNSRICDLPNNDSNDINESKINNSSSSFDKLPEKNNVEELENNNMLKIELIREFDCFVFFVKAKGYPFLLCKGKAYIKIGTIIEHYIKTFNVNEEMKFNFYYNDIQIKNLDKTLSEFGINDLSVISSK